MFLVLNLSFSLMKLCSKSSGKKNTQHCSKYLQMDSNAQMSCMMRVNVHCDGCKRKMMEVLQNLKVYSVVLDAEQGTLKVNGKVNPSTILNVFDKFGKHGEVSSLRFDGEVMEQIPYSFYGDNPYNPYEVPYPPIPYPFFRGPEQQLYGRNPYLMPMPPPLLGTKPPPPWPPPPQQHPPPPPLLQHQLQQQPSPVSKAPSAPPAPLPPDPKCCTIM
ncbi:PREDICTED: neural Wiskott-Aldrich syndrome protein isoform X2 [Populus euphratica]|uniref:Neural Wiskott-Aldrich syndrome protein isoform X2 n=1 Tax=Populus euphratica TaxID=75702 RepID=A0AAJ6V1C8_POPEU|nr:PREDICTED: neural Wiskott-Aldrich syndrome protein isoform X2 [Populus euphratica]